MTETEPFWYLASYPKSGNTWCRVFITELRRLAGLNSARRQEAAGIAAQELQLNRDVTTGAIVSCRRWIDDQLGIDSSDLRCDELDRMRGSIGHQRALYTHPIRYHKVHDAFTTPDSAGRPMVSVEGCQGVVYLIRNPADVAVSLSHFFCWDLDRCVAFLLDERAGLCDSNQRGGLQVRQFMGTWANHVHSWLEQQKLPVLLLRYEDLLLQPELHFQRLATFLALPAHPSLIAAAVATTRLEHLRAKEELEGGFHETTTRSSAFFRSGRSGEGLERLTPDQLRQLQEAFGPTMGRFAYAPLGTTA